METTDALPLTLIIITPDKKIPDIRCDSISIPVCDNKKGKSGGLYGIRKGHIDCLIAVGEGEITAKADGNVIYKEALSGGIAQIKSNTVTLTTTH